jgi:hypothetical protein
LIGSPLWCNIILYHICDIQPRQKGETAMKKQIFIILLSILCFPAIAQSLNGYGNAEWGSNIQAIRGIWPTLRRGIYPGRIGIPSGKD